MWSSTPVRSSPSACPIKASFRWRCAGSPQPSPPLKAYARILISDLPPAAPSHADVPHFARSRHSAASDLLEWLVLLLAQLARLDSRRFTDQQHSTHPSFSANWTAYSLILGVVWLDGRSGGAAGWSFLEAHRCLAITKPAAEASASSIRADPSWSIADAWSLNLTCAPILGSPLSLRLFHFEAASLSIKFRLFGQA